MADDQSVDASTRVPSHKIEVQHAHETAAMLTAAAYGLDALCFVAPCDGVTLGVLLRSLIVEIFRTFMVT